MIGHILVRNRKSVADVSLLMRLKFLYRIVEGYADEGASVISVLGIGKWHFRFVLLIHLAQLVCIKAFVKDTAEGIGVQLAVLYCAVRRKTASDVCSAIDLTSVKRYDSQVFVFFLFCRILVFHRYPSFLEIVFLFYHISRQNAINKR